MNLDNLTTSLIQHIASFVSQHDRITMVLSSKSQIAFYPTTLVYAFLPTASVQEYERFAHCCVKYKVENIDVTIDPVKWDVAARPLLINMHFQHVSLQPLRMFHVAAHVWFPQCTSYTSGFFEWPNALAISTNWDEYTPCHTRRPVALDLENTSDTPVQFPVFPWGALWHMSITGKFTGFDRLPLDDPELKFVRVLGGSLSAADAHSLTSFHRDMELVYCEIEAGVKIELSLEWFRTSFETLHHVTSLQARDLGVLFQGTFPTDVAIYTHPFERVFAYGMMHATETQVEQFLSMHFPNSRQYQLSSVKCVP